jgi:hypothetical protein
MPPITGSRKQNGEGAQSLAVSVDKLVSAPLFLLSRLRIELSDDFASRIYSLALLCRRVVTHFYRMFRIPESAQARCRHSGASPYYFEILISTLGG